MRFPTAIRHVGRCAVVAGISAATAITPAAADAGSFWYLSFHRPTKAAATLNAATAVSSTEVWVVGGIADFDTGRSSALVGRLTGGFIPVPGAPADPELEVVLSDVDAAGDDVWAVGRASSDTGSTQARIERYDRRDPASGGQAQPSPSPDTTSVLHGVDMLSAEHGWAVGAHGPDEEASRTLVVRWDGNAWSQVPSPNPGTGTNHLNGVAARAPDDVWAVGHTTGSDPSGPARSLVLHWDGTAWTRIPSPDPATGDSKLLSVAVAGNDIWAVGYGSPDASDPGDGQRRAIAMRWDGRTWLVLHAQSFGVTEFNDVTAVSETAVWFVGCKRTATPENGYLEQVHFEYWDGSALQLDRFERTTSSGHVASALYGISAGPSGGPLWAVGWQATTTVPTWHPAIFRMDL